MIAGITGRDLADVAVAGFLSGMVLLLIRRLPVSKLAGRTRLVIAATALLPVAIRLVLLPVVPPSEPQIHDEFGHLLVADTLAAVRLANPPHPMRRSLETVYILQEPAYASIYPIGHGASLALGKQIAGHPWAGVLLSVALMCGAIGWALYGCLPPPAAAAGALIAVFMYGLAPRWLDSYWGGAFTAFGGAMLFGSLCRLRHAPSPALALAGGLGWSIVWLTRPFESVPLVAVVIGSLALFTWRGEWKRWIATAFAFALLPVLAGGLTLLHNHAVTGSYTTLPYQLSQRLYGVPQSLLWQDPVPEPAMQIAEQKQMYAEQLAVKLRTSARPFDRLGGVLASAWSFFVTPWFSLPLALAAFLWKDRMVLLGLAFVAVALAAGALYPFFHSHYVAAYACVFIFLIVRGLMVIERRVFGRALAIFLVTGAILLGLRIVPLRALAGRGEVRQPTARTQTIQRLTSMGGRHVVFVRYGKDHSFYDELVFNAADIDEQPIVWVRWLTPALNAEVFRYYQGRRFWIADVGRGDVRLSSYTAP